MEKGTRPQPLSRADIRHQRKAINRNTKPVRIAIKKAEGEKVNKMSNRPKVKDQKSKRPIQQARLINH